MSSSAAPEVPRSDPILQYIVIRSDLWKDLGWPVGAVVAQACHVSSAAIWMSRTDPTTEEYLSDENIDHMHKVCLEVKGEKQLRGLSQTLQDNDVPHKLWVEQPEDFPTALALTPRRKSDVSAYLKKFQLSRAVILDKKDHDTLLQQKTSTS